MKFLFLFLVLFQQKLPQTTFPKLPQSTLEVPKPVIKPAIETPKPVIETPKPVIKPVETPVFRGPLHSHRCGNCGYVWSHDDSSFGNRQAHTCPRCGSGPWWTQVPGSRTIPQQMIIAPQRMMNFCPT